MALDAGHKSPPPAACRARQVVVDLICSKNFSRVARTPVRSGSLRSVSPAQPVTPDPCFESQSDPVACAPFPSLMPPGRPEAAEKFCTEDRSHKPCEVEPDHRLESAANVQTDTDLHVRPRVSNRTDEKSPKRRDGIRNTRGVASRNGIDFALRGS